MSRKLCITAVDGNTGFLIAELLMTDDRFSKHLASVTGLSLHPTAPKCKELTEMGVKIVPHKPGKLRTMVSVLQEMGVDTICLIPPAHAEKYDITVELIEAAKKAGVQNVLFISSAGCDVAESSKQPHLRQFMELEKLVMQTKGDTSTATGHSPAIIRAGFYAENLLLYSPQAQKEGILPIPIGTQHKFAPVSLGDIALAAAHILSAHGKHGFADKHRGQLVIITGPMLASGDELASAASKALGTEMTFEDISEAEARKTLQHQSHSDPSEILYLLEYYSLVREGKTNYVSTAAFHDITQVHAQEPVEFFKTYGKEFELAQRDNHDKKRRKVGNGGK